MYYHTTLQQYFKEAPFVVALVLSILRLYLANGGSLATSVPSSANLI